MGDQLSPNGGTRATSSFHLTNDEEGIARNERCIELRKPPNIPWDLPRPILPNTRASLHPHSAFIDSVGQNENSTLASLSRPSVSLPENAAFRSQGNGMATPTNHMRFAAHRASSDIQTRLDIQHISLHDDEETYRKAAQKEAEESDVWRGGRRNHGTMSTHELQSLTETCELRHGIYNNRCLAQREATNEHEGFAS